MRNALQLFGDKVGQTAASRVGHTDVSETQILLNVYTCYYYYYYCDYYYHKYYCYYYHYYYHYCVYCKVLLQVLPTITPNPSLCRHCVHVTALQYFPLHILAISAQLWRLQVACFTNADPSVIPDTLRGLYCNLKTSNRRWPSSTLVTNSYP